MSDEQRLRDYYDAEAAAGVRAAMGSRGRRDELRADFVELLQAEGRRSVIDVGSGPGGDVAALGAAGVDCIGLDLSVGNARVAGSARLTVIPASLYAPPIRLASFEAGWTMSTLLHVPDARFDEAMRAIIAVLMPGAPLAIGLWGGRDWERVETEDHFDPPRFFSARSDGRVQEMLRRHGAIESFESWPNDRGDGTYQFIVLRT